MKLTYDLYNRTEPSKIYLARPGKKLVCVLNGIDEGSVSLTLNLNNTHELSFDVYRYVDGEESAGYDMLERFMDLYVTGIGWFKIQHPETSDNGTKEVRHVTAESLEIELQQYDLTGFKINCGTEDSLEILASVNKNVTDPENIKNVKFYHPEDPELSFLDLVLENVPGWSAGYVDPYIDTTADNYTPLKDSVAKFDVDNQDIYSFLCQEAAGAYNCIFVFDTESCTINAYRPEGLGEETNIYIGFRNLQNSVEISVDADSIYTVFNVAGDGDLNIDYVNFGSSRIEDLSYFLSPTFLPPDLIDKYIYWRDYMESKRPEYIEASAGYNTQLEIVTELTDRQPNDGCGTDWSTFSDEDLGNAKKDYETQKKAYEDLYVDENGKFDYEALKNSPDFTDYQLITETILANIAIEMANRKLDDDADYTDYLDAWETDWKLFGLDELKAKLQGYQDTITTLKRNGFNVPYSKENSKYTENYHDQMHEQYKEAVQNHTDCLAAIGSDEPGQEAGRKGEIKAAKDIMESFNATRRNLEKDVSKENEQFDFTKLELIILGKLYNATDYVNNNIITTSLDTQVTTIDAQLKLLEAAKEQLSIESQPQFTYSTSQDNLLALSDYHDMHGDLRLGNYIRIGLRDDWEVKLRVISLSFNPLLMDNKLDIGFSNMIMSSSKRNDFASIIDRSTRSSKNQITIGSSGKDETPISMGLLNALLNSSRFKNMGTEIVSDSVRAAVGAFGSLTADFMKVSELEAEIAKIDNLDADSIFAKHLSTLFLTADKLITKDMQSSTGTFTDWLTGVNIYANNITGGTLSVDRLEIRGSGKSIVYAINNVTGALQAQNVDTINGEVLTERTVTADRIVANSITATEIKAGSITAKEMKSGSITADDGIIASLKADVIESGTFDANKVNVINLSASSIETGELDAEKVSIKNLKADVMQSGTIDASKVNIVKLNAHNISAGSLSADSIKGGTLSGSEIRLGNGAFTVDITGNLRVKNADISGNFYAHGSTFQSVWLESTSLCVNYDTVIYGNNVFVAIGDVLYTDNIYCVATISTSKDGINWNTEYVLSPDETDSSIPLDIIFADNKFTCVGTNGYITTSTDGLNWNAMQIEPNISIVNVLYGNSTYILNCVDDNDKVKLLYSTDGESWATNDLNINSSYISLAFGNGTFVLATAEGEIYTSNYGIEWDICSTASGIPEFNSLAFYKDGIYADGVFVIEDKDMCRISQDGRNWMDPVSVNSDIQFVIKKYVNNIWIGLAYSLYPNNMTLYYSQNNYDWNIIGANSKLPCGISDFIFINGIYVFVCMDNYIYYTNDLNSPLQKAILSQSPSLNAVTQFNEYFIIVGDNGTILYTPIDYTEINTISSGTNANLNKIVTFNNNCYIVGSCGCILFSSTGTSFAPIKSSTNDDLKDILIHNDKLYILGVHGTLLSMDKNHTISMSTISNNTITNSLAYIDGQFICVGNKGCSFKSIDLKNWERINTYTNENINSITNLGEQLVAVGDNGVILIYSYETWEKLPCDNSLDLSYVTNIDNRLITLGDGIVLVSNDGCTWSTLTDNSIYTYNYIIKNSNKFLLVGDECRISDLYITFSSIQTTVTIDQNGLSFSLGNEYTEGELQLLYADGSTNLLSDPHLVIPDLECDHIGRRRKDGIFFEVDEELAPSHIRFADDCYFDKKIYEDGKALSQKYLQFKSTEGYNGIMANGSETNWIRTTKNGLIPFAKGSSSSIGTKDWKFTTIYAVNFNENGKLLTDKYQAKGSYAASSHTHGSIRSSTAKKGVGVSSDGTIFRAYNYASGTVVLDGAMNLGSGGGRWKKVYSSSAAISTSDRNCKENITPLEDRYEELFLKLKPVSYQYRNLSPGENHDRIHTGFISQDVKQAMDEVGLTDLEFAAFCVDDLSADPESGLTGLRYSLAYDEFISLNTHMLQKTIARIENDEDKITLLEKEIETLKSELKKLKTN